MSGSGVLHRKMTGFTPVRNASNCWQMKAMDTLVIHSKDEEVIRQFALKKPVARMLVNTRLCSGAWG